MFLGQYNHISNGAGSSSLKTFLPPLSSLASAGCAGNRCLAPIRFVWFSLVQFGSVRFGLVLSNSASFGTHTLASLQI